MNTVIRKIEMALKQLYALESNFLAEDYLLNSPPENPSNSLFHASLDGALYVKSNRVLGSGKSVSLGIYLSGAIQDELADFPNWQRGNWSRNQLNSFCVASEEISHFHYFLYHALKDRPVTRLELELQAEVDKFFLSYFSQFGDEKQDEKAFDSLFEQLFYHFHLAESLNREETERYEIANRFARKFIRKYRSPLLRQKNYEKILSSLRRFYRLGPAEKISMVAP